MTALTPPPEAPPLAAEGLTVRLDARSAARPAVDGVSLALPPGTMAALLGPNGAGKTTLIRAMAGVTAPSAGRVTLAGAELSRMSRRAAARAIAYLPQQSESRFELTVAEVVRMGRYPHVGALGGMTRADFECVEWAMARVGVTALSARPLPSLSGGERQRVFLARALAQGAPILLLDEPATGLDIGRQLELMDLLAELNREGRTVLAAVHDPRLADEHFPRAVLLADGRLADDGPTRRVITGPAFSAAFGVAVTEGSGGELVLRRERLAVSR
jgi:iron complex transport system ATP-binding protein